jgi:hypothetical protein
MTDAPPSANRSECYVIEVDGLPRFEFRIFGQALSAALLLRSDFPRCTVKLRNADEVSAPSTEPKAPS